MANLGEVWHCFHKTNPIESGFEVGEKRSWPFKITSDKLKMCISVEIRSPLINSLSANRMPAAYAEYLGVEKKHWQHLQNFCRAFNSSGSSSRANNSITIKKKKSVAGRKRDDMVSIRHWHDNRTNEWQKFLFGSFSWIEPVFFYFHSM